jgi:pyruvate formate-lyase activating enzyme-like uncharacterized protein
MSIKKYEYGSAVNGRTLAEGCKHCMEGSKMVLLVTGRCNTGCFYCPVSQEKKGKDVIYANEKRVLNSEEILAEAESIEATGTGITGGDPLGVMDRTLEMISLLKTRFGTVHHIHLYTSMIDVEKVRKLEAAGLDEIRFHPSPDVWDKLETTELSEIVKTSKIDVGIEVPAIPGMKEQLDALVKYATKIKIKFINLNELEFSESNWDMMIEKGFDIRDDISASVMGSSEMAMELMLENRKAPIHFCSSVFKDGVQLRKRLIRRANHIARPLDVVTEDGTILKGIVYSDDLDEARDFFMNEYEVPAELIHIDNAKKRLEVASWVLEEIAEEVPYKCYVVEEYSTADRLEVERMPLN